VTPRARILPCGEASRARPLLAPGVSDGTRRRIGREEIEARLAAEGIVRDARARADALIAETAKKAETLVVAAVREAREAANAELAAKWLALRQTEAGAIARDGERVISLAVALAERLLGASLALEPSRIVGLARAVIDEARGARRAVVEAHPLDAVELLQRLTTNGLELQSIEIRGDDALARGELRLHTDVGTIDARLAPRFERLAAALRDALE
jgi:flagellar assembly protein FliH